MEAVGLDGGGWMGWRVGGRRWMEGPGWGWRAAAWMEGWAWGSGSDGGMEGAGRGGVEGWRGLSGWRDRTAQTEPHKPNCKKNRTETKAKPIPETETNRNEPRLYCACRLRLEALRLWDYSSCASRILQLLMRFMMPCCYYGRLLLWQSSPSNQTDLKLDECILVPESCNYFSSQGDNILTGQSKTNPYTLNLKTLIPKA